MPQQMADGRLDRLRRRLVKIHKEELEDGYVLLHHQNCCFRFGNNPPPARIKLPPAALFAVMGIACRNTHFLFAKKKQKQGRKDGENEWRFTT